MGFWGKKTEETVGAGGAGSTMGVNASSGVAQSSKDDVLSAEADILLSRFGKVRSALSAGTVIQGKLSFDMPVSIDGKLSGEVFSSDVLIVGQSAIIDAQLDVASLVVRGTVKGSISAHQRIEVLSGGRLEGEVRTPLLKIEEGAVFDGRCLMTQIKKA